MNAFSRYLFTLILITLSSVTIAETTLTLPPINSDIWELHKKAGQIKIYIGNIKGSNLDGFKAVATLHAPIQNLIAVMETPTSCVEWVENCTNSYGFGAKSFNERYGYTSSHLPWPFKDRDLVVAITTSNNIDNGEIRIEMHAVENKVPNNDNNVRIHIATTEYIFKKIDEQNTKVIWRQHADPTGSLPSWLVNALIVDIPLKSLQRIEKVANSPKYSGYKLVYDPAGKLIGVQK